MKGQLNPKPVLRAFDFYLKSRLNSSHAMTLSTNNSSMMTSPVMIPIVVPGFK